MSITNSPLVSVIVPTRNSAQFLENCLRSVQNQTYKNIEIIVIDNNSRDTTKQIALKYTPYYFDISNINSFNGKFSATFQRNYGVNISKGKIVYYFDADMEMQSGVIQECVRLIQTDQASAVIIPEDSFGPTFWAKCKQLERRCYWGDDSIEAPRCLVKQVWAMVGGLDEAIAGGGDDWDLHEKLKDRKYIIRRTKSLVMHNEGMLTLKKLFLKRFLYGKDTVKYIGKRKGIAISQYFPIRKGFVKNWPLFLRDPIIGIGTIYMRLVEYVAGGLGMIYTIFKT